jgi:predicted RNA-binding protein
VEETMIAILEMEDVIYSSVVEEKTQLQTIMKLKET